MVNNGTNTRVRFSVFLLAGIHLLIIATGVDRVGEDMYVASARVLLLLACCGVAATFRGAAPPRAPACRGGARRLHCHQQSPSGASKGLNVLELTGALVPQGKNLVLQASTCSS
jgi:hypothetical protein